MRINPAEFFRFCSRHTTLLRELAEHTEGDLSDPQLFDLVRRTASEGDEQPETVVKQLKKLRVVEPVEQGEGFYIVAGPLLQLLRYLFHTAKPASPETVQGYVKSLGERCKLLARATEAEDVTHAEMTIADINQTLRRIYDDGAETHQSILTAVAEFKTNRTGVSVRQKFQRIVYWMEVYVIPMVHIIRVDGEMEATFAEVERLLRLASDRTVFNDFEALGRTVRFIRLVRRHALRIFEQCRREIQPLYQALARSNNIAAGAAVALERLRRDGFQNWGTEPLVAIYSFRQQYAVTDAAIKSVLERVILQPAEVPPVVDFNEEGGEPDGMRHSRWLESLPEVAAANVPMEDLLAWLIEQNPNHPTSEVLAGFAALFFHDRFHGHFTGGDIHTYETPDHVLRAHPVRLELADK